MPRPGAPAPPAVRSSCSCPARSTGRRPPCSSWGPSSSTSARSLPSSPPWARRRLGTTSGAPTSSDRSASWSPASLAWFEVCHGWTAWRPSSLAWWITGVNLAGSVAFGFSAVASYVIPGTTELLSVPVTNLGTFIGALCFLAGAVLLLFERTEELPAVTPAPPRLSGPAAARPAVTGRATSSGWSGPSRSCGAGSRRPA